MNNEELIMNNGRNALHFCMCKGGHCVCPIKIIKGMMGEMDSLFTEIDEEFVCENCGHTVPKLGYSCRNHCNKCLHSKHVDVNPGDRQEKCHGLLEPIGVEISPKKGYVIIYKCKKCGSVRKNKAAKDDNLDLIISLSVNKYK